MSLLGNSKEATPSGRAQNDQYPGNEQDGKELDDTPIKLLRPRIFIMGMIVSLGGLIFGYDIGLVFLYQHTRSTSNAKY